MTNNTYTFESPAVTALILDATIGPDAAWDDPTDLCEAITNTIRFVFGDDHTILIDPPLESDFVVVTAPRSVSPDTVEDRIRSAVIANMPEEA